MSEAAAQRLLLRGGRSAAFGFLIRFGARLLLLLVAGRLFGATLFGAFAIAVALVELAVTIGGAGMKRLLYKLLDEEQDGRPPPHLLLDAALLVVAASLLPAAAILAAAIWLPLADNSALAMLLLAPAVLGQSLIDLFLAATRWTHKMRWDVWARSVLEPYAGVAAAVLAWWLGYETTGLVIGYWAGTLAALAWSFAGARACLGPFALGRWRFDPARMAMMLRETALPTLGDFASGLYVRLDLYLVGLLLGEAPAGIYGMARQLRTPIRQVRQSFDGLLAPVVSRTLGRTDAVQTGRALASAARLILAIQLGMLVAMFAVGEPLLRLIGPEFAAGFLAMLLLAAAETIQSAFGVGDLLLLYRRPAALLWITAAGAAANLLAGWWLIPQFGIAGAAIAALLAAVAAALVRRFWLHLGFAAAGSVRQAARVLVAAALGIGTVVGLGIALAGAGEGLRVALAAGLGLTVYAVTLRLLRARLRLTDFVTE